MKVLGGEREEGKLYYLVVAAMGPNYGYAFVSVLKTFTPLFKKQKTKIHLFTLHLTFVTLLVTHTLQTNLSQTSVQLLQFS